MISFPSALNTSGSARNLPSTVTMDPSRILKNMGKEFLNSSLNRVMGGVLSWVHGNDTYISGASKSKYNDSVKIIPYNHVPADNLILAKPQESQTSISFKELKRKNGSEYENALIVNPNFYSVINSYRYVYSGRSLVPMTMTNEDLSTGQASANGAGDKNAKSKEASTTKNAKTGGAGVFHKGALSPSLFNPYYGVQRIGATRNTPLLDNVLSTNPKLDTNFTDCSIKRLCDLSKRRNSELGAAKYKYTDFMYCKDLGMPNNRLITLRRFTHPIGDMIFGSGATGKIGPYSTPGDVGRLVAYFDTDDNKLEDILQYSFHATWEERTGKIDQQGSQEDNQPSLLGSLVNAASGNYASQMLKGNAAGNNILDWVVDRYGGPLKNMGSASSPWYNPMTTEVNYDKNKVYEPINTVRKTHLYTGELLFSHEFTLTFNYTLRSYDNINPKSAMLDLLANITAVTFRRGNFWGGRNEILGAQPNHGGWKIANSIVNNTFDQLGGIFGTIGGFFKNSFGDMMSWFGELSKYIDSEGVMAGVGKIFSDVGDATGNMVEKINESVQKVVDNTTKENVKKTVQKAKNSTIGKGISQLGGNIFKNLGSMIKGRVMNAFGRRQKYQFSSILSGSDVGYWHVTIGNPLNPIAVMGNLILDDATIQHYGPLGQDDFPTGLLVKVKLKHARPRDMVDIQKMYTRGIMAVYQHMNTAAAGHWSRTQAGIMYLGEADPEKIQRNVSELR